MAHLNIYPDGRMELRKGPPPAGANVVKRLNMDPQEYPKLRPKLTVKPVKSCCTGEKKP